jgi:hypothetical protein
MSAIISTNRGGVCGICLEGFSSSDLQLTHKGGEGHDGFHKPCLKNWLQARSVCPIDGQPINRGALINRNEVDEERFQKAALCAISAAYFGVVLATIGMSAQTGWKKGGDFAQISKMPLLEITGPGLQIVGGVAAGTLSSVISLGGGFLAKAIGGGSLAETAVTVLGAIAIKRELEETEDTVGLGDLAVASLGLFLIANRIHSNIGYGMLVGGAAPLVAGNVFNSREDSLVLSSALPLIAAATAGVVSLIRG